MPQLMSCAAAAVINPHSPVRARKEGFAAQMKRLIIRFTLCFEPQHQRTNSVVLPCRVHAVVQVSGPAYF